MASSGAPLRGSPGEGNVCRSTSGTLQGVRVYSDVMDRWAGSRTVWNQHAYSVTHVEDDGTVPRGRDMERNWETAGLNNFRQNVQGDLARDAGPDVTVRGAGFGEGCDESSPSTAPAARRRSTEAARGRDATARHAGPELSGRGPRRCPPRSVAPA